MPNNNSLLRQGLLALVALLSTRSFGESLIINKSTLAQAGVPTEVVRNMLAAGILTAESASCFKVDPIRLGNLSAVQNDKDLIDFKAWVEEVTANEVAVGICTAHTAALGSNDFTR
jgi:hypothetical protein